MDTDVLLLTVKSLASDPTQYVSILRILRDTFDESGKHLSKIYSNCDSWTNVRRSERSTLKSVSDYLVREVGVSRLDIVAQASDFPNVFEKKKEQDRTFGDNPVVLGASIEALVSAAVTRRSVRDILVVVVLEAAATLLAVLDHWSTYYGSRGASVASDSKIMESVMATARITDNAPMAVDISAGVFKLLFALLLSPLNSPASASNCVDESRLDAIRRYILVGTLRVLKVHLFQLSQCSKVFSSGHLGAREGAFARNAGVNLGNLKMQLRHIGAVGSHTDLDRVRTKIVDIAVGRAGCNRAREVARALLKESFPMFFFTPFRRVEYALTEFRKLCKQLAKRDSVKASKAPPTSSGKGEGVDSYLLNIHRCEFPVLHDRTFWSEVWTNQHFAWVLPLSSSTFTERDVHECNLNSVLATIADSVIQDGSEGFVYSFRSAKLPLASLVTAHRYFLGELHNLVLGIFKSASAICVTEHINVRVRVASKLFRTLCSHCMHLCRIANQRCDVGKQPSVSVVALLRRLVHPLVTGLISICMSWQHLSRVSSTPISSGITHDGGDEADHPRDAVSKRGGLHESDDENEDARERENRDDEDGEARDGIPLHRHFSPMSLIFPAKEKEEKAATGEIVRDEPSSAFKQIGGLHFESSHALLRNAIKSLTGLIKKIDQCAANTCVTSQQQEWFVDLEMSLGAFLAALCRDAVSAPVALLRNDDVDKSSQWFWTSPLVQGGLRRQWKACFPVNKSVEWKDPEWLDSISSIQGATIRKVHQKFWKKRVEVRVAACEIVETAWVLSARYVALQQGLEKNPPVSSMKITMQNLRSSSALRTCFVKIWKSVCSKVCKIAMRERQTLKEVKLGKGDGAKSTNALTSGVSSFNRTLLSVVVRARVLRECLDVPNTERSLDVEKRLTTCVDHVIRFCTHDGGRESDNDSLSLASVMKRLHRLKQCAKSRVTCTATIADLVEHLQLLPLRQQLLSAMLRGLRDEHYNAGLYGSGQLDANARAFFRLCKSARNTCLKKGATSSERVAVLCADSANQILSISLLCAAFAPRRAQSCRLNCNGRNISSSDASSWEDFSEASSRRFVTEEEIKYIRALKMLDVLNPLLVSHYTLSAATKRRKIELVEENIAASHAMVDTTSRITALDEDVTEEVFPALKLWIETEGMFDDASSLVDICVQGKRALVIHRSGRIYAVGDNVSGSCGVGAKGKIGVLSEVAGFKKGQRDAAMVEVNAQVTAIVTRDGELFTVGHNRDGELGQNVDVSSKCSPAPVVFKRPQRILAVACGEHHMVCLTYTDEVYSWGNNKRGQLGLGRIGGVARAPIKINALCGRQLKRGRGALSAGRMHTLALTFRGGVWAWGDDSNGQLCRGRRPNHCWVFESPEPKSESSTPVPLILRTHKIETIACAGDNTAMVSEGGILFLCGDDSKGQLLSALSRSGLSNDIDDREGPRISQRVRIGVDLRKNHKLRPKWSGFLRAVPLPGPCVHIHMKTDHVFALVDNGFDGWAPDASERDTEIVRARRLLGWLLLSAGVAPGSVVVENVEYLIKANVRSVPSLQRMSLTQLTDVCSLSKDEAVQLQRLCASVKMLASKDSGVSSDSNASNETRALSRRQIMGWGNIPDVFDDALQSLGGRKTPWLPRLVVEHERKISEGTALACRLVSSRAGCFFTWENPCEVALAGNSAEKGTIRTSRATSLRVRSGDKSQRALSLLSKMRLRAEHTSWLVLRLWAQTVGRNSESGESSSSSSDASVVFEREIVEWCIASLRRATTLTTSGSGNLTPLTTPVLQILSRLVVSSPVRVPRLLLGSKNCGALPELLSLLSRKPQNGDTRAAAIRLLGHLLPLTSPAVFVKSLRELQRKIGVGGDDSLFPDITSLNDAELRESAVLVWFRIIGRAHFEFNSKENVSGKGHHQRCVVAAEVVALIRRLIHVESKDYSWRSLFSQVLRRSLVANETVCTKRRETLWNFVGALGVLGGVVEPLRGGCRVELSFDGFDAPQHKTGRVVQIDRSYERGKLQIKSVDVLVEKAMGSRLPGALLQDSVVSVSPARVQAVCSEPLNLLHIESHALILGIVFNLACSSSSLSVDLSHEQGSVPLMILQIQTMASKALRTLLRSSDVFVRDFVRMQLLRPFVSELRFAESQVLVDITKPLSSKETSDDDGGSDSGGDEKMWKVLKSKTSPLSPDLSLTDLERGWIDVRRALLREKDNVAQDGVGATRTLLVRVHDVAGLSLSAKRMFVRGGYYFCDLLLYENHDSVQMKRTSTSYCKSGAPCWNEIDGTISFTTTNARDAELEVMLRCSSDLGSTDSDDVDDKSATSAPSSSFFGSFRICVGLLTSKARTFCDEHSASASLNASLIRVPIRAPKEIGHPENLERANSSTGRGAYDYGSIGIAVAIVHGSEFSALGGEEKEGEEDIPPLPPTPPNRTVVASSGVVGDHATKETGKTEEKLDDRASHHELARTLFGDDSASPSVLTWSFDGAIVSMCGRPRWLAVFSARSEGALSTEFSISDDDFDVVEASAFEKASLSSAHCVARRSRRVLRVPQGSTIVAKNGFGGGPNDDLAYVNAYSVLLDVRFNGGSDISPIVPILSSSVCEMVEGVSLSSSDSSYEWCVKPTDGSMSYGAEVVISGVNDDDAKTSASKLASGGWVRLAMVVDTTSSVIRWYVDGELVRELRDSSLLKRDGRWSLDSLVGILPDSPEGIYLSSLQLREYAMRPDEIKALGPASFWGLPLHCVRDTTRALASRLSTIANRGANGAQCPSIFEASDFENALRRSTGNLQAAEEFLVLLLPSTVPRRRRMEHYMKVHLRGDADTSVHDTSVHNVIWKSPNAASEACVARDLSSSMNELLHHKAPDIWSEIIGGDEESAASDGSPADVLSQFGIKKMPTSNNAKLRRGSLVDNSSHVQLISERSPCDMNSEQAAHLTLRRLRAAYLRDSMVNLLAVASSTVSSPSSSAASVLNKRFEDLVLRGDFETSFHFIRSMIGNDGTSSIRSSQSKDSCRVKGNVAHQLLRKYFVRKLTSSSASTNDATTAPDGCKTLFEQRLLSIALGCLISMTVASKSPLVVLRDSTRINWTCLWRSPKQLSPYSHFICKGTPPKGYKLLGDRLLVQPRFDHSSKIGATFLGGVSSSGVAVKSAGGFASNSPLCEPSKAELMWTSRRWDIPISLYRL
eukprot:g3613.t1